jgi:predicted nucleic acid-binding protein
MDEILDQLPYRFLVGGRAREKAQWLAVPDSEEREPVQLQPLIEAGLLVEERLQAGPEETLFVEFSAQLADGEAEAAALAVLRGYILATDDRKASRIVVERDAAVRLYSTLELLREWQQVSGASDADVADALKRISERATYRPRRTDPLFAWWSALFK